MKKSIKFCGTQVTDFMLFHKGMPVQSTPVKEHCTSMRFDYDAFRFACDDYMRGLWRSSAYRIPRCPDNPSPGCFRHVNGIMGKGKRLRKKRGTRGTGRVSVASFMTQEQIEFLLAYQSERCPCCEAILTRCGYHVDHIMPIKLGGGNDAWNIQLLCHGCNTRKSAMDPHKWAEMHGIELPKYFILKAHPFK